MRVLHVIHHLDRGGGVVVQALNLARALDIAGCQVRFLTTRSASTDPTSSMSVGHIPVTYAPTYAPTSAIPCFFYRSALSLSKSDTFSVIQAFDAFVSGSAVAAFGRSRPSIPTLVRLGTDYLAHYSYQFQLPTGTSSPDLVISSVRRTALLKTLSVAESVILSSVDAVVANCNYLKKVYQARIPKIRRLVVITNGVDTTTFQPEGPAAALGEGRDWLLFVGRIEERKGLNYLIRAMSRVRSEYPRAALLVVGRAPRLEYLAELKRLARRMSVDSNIVFSDPVPNRRVPELMRAARVVVFSSTTGQAEVEGLPNIVLEAMSTGKPVVASSVCGVPEVINHKKTGVLTRPGSSDDIASAIIGLLDSPTECSEIGLRAREFILNNNTMTRAARQYRLLYELLLSKHS